MNNKREVIFKRVRQRLIVVFKQGHNLDIEEEVIDKIDWHRTILNWIEYAEPIQVSESDRPIYLTKMR